MDVPANIFVDLVKLEDLSAGRIVRNLLSALEGIKFTEDFLSKTLIGITCGGASVMLGHKSGVATKLQALFPNITARHTGLSSHSAMW